MNKTKDKIQKNELNSKKKSFDEIYSKTSSKPKINFPININNEEEKEIEINNDLMNISTLSQPEVIMEFEISPIETISIKQFRNLLGIFGSKSNNFIIERLYQTLIRTCSNKNYEHNTSNLTDKNFMNYLTILNGNKKTREIFYTFFDISNKGYITKKDFITVAENMCSTICEFGGKNPNAYKTKIENFYENVLRNKENKNNKGICKEIFMSIIDQINFYEIMNYNKEIENKNDVSNNILFYVKYLINNIKQKEDIETNLTIATDSYFENIETIKEEEENDNNSIYLSNTSSLIDNNKNNFGLKFDNITYSNKSFATLSNIKNDNLSSITNNTLNTNNKTSFLISPKIISDTKIKSLKERIFNNNNDDEIKEIISSNNSDTIEEDIDIDYDFLNEEDNKDIKDIENIQKNKIKISNNMPPEKNQKKNFYFLKPFRPKNDKLLEDELKKNNIDINDSLILLKKNNFLNYLDSLKNIYKQIKPKASEAIKEKIPKSLSSDITPLNKPLKEKENFDKEKKFEKDLNNFNIELIVAIISGIEKCISSLGDFNLQDKTYINNIINQDNNINLKLNKTIKNSIFSIKIEEKDSINSNLEEIISNYPFKINKFSFEQKNNFCYTFYTMDKNIENKININKAEITEYAPEIFCNIRYNLGEITNKNFLKSFNLENLISDIFLGKINNLSDLLTINKEKYPEFIMFSTDTKYLVKCITQNEFDFFYKLLPNYYDFLMDCIYKNIHKNYIDERNSISSTTFCTSNINQGNSTKIDSRLTFLELIYGLYSFSFDEYKLFFIIKKNIFYSYNNLLINKRYDLKGSSVDRRAKPNSPYVFKDLDFIESNQKINISNKISRNILDIIENDTSFLSRNNIINYSFYLGISDLNENFENDENDEGYLSSDKNCKYYFGINDILTEYGKGKAAEHIFKKITKGDGISAVPPEDYKLRFDNFIKSCFN